MLRTNIMKDVSEEEKTKLWLENQNRCIHTALNLEFIKSLTGEPDKLKTKYDCHCSSIMKFPELLCSLPEVKEKSSLSEDSLGIKETFTEFISYCK